MAQHSPLRRSTVTLLLALAPCACGGAVNAGVALGDSGRDLSVRATTVPQAAEVCALQDAVASTNPGAEKPSSDVCAKALKTDLLWRRAMIVLAAYADTLKVLAQGGSSAETVGRMQGATTGVQGTSWLDVESGDAVARDAVAQLARQMSEGTAKGDLGQALKDAGPHVRTLCDGLTAYLDTQAHNLADLSREVDKKRTMHADRRCGNLDTRSVCVTENVLDRMVYANVYGEAALLERSHVEARESLAGFCAAHRKLEDAAAHGDLGSDKAFRDVLEAVAAAHRVQDTPTPAPKGKK